MELPASEIVFWEEYFNIYPFTQDREDARTAQVAQTVTNMQGRFAKNPLPLSYFLPDFYDEKKDNYTIEEQTQRALAFREKMQRLQG